MIATISADGKGEQFYYNNNGQLESRARVNLAKGYSDLYQRYYYDQAGQRYQEDIYGETSYTSLTRYDRYGQIIESKGQGMHQTFGYDLQGNREREAWLDSDGIEQGVKSATFNARGLMASQTLIDGSKLSFDYNSFNALKTKTGESGYVAQYSYYNNGLLKSELVAGETQEQFSYDINGRETERKILSADGSRLLHTHSEYDEAGRLKKLVTSEAKWGDKQLGRAEIQYDYDAVGNRRRITTIHHQPDGQTTTDVDWYAYDIDNRMTVRNNGTPITFCANSHSVP